MTDSIKVYTYINKEFYEILHLSDEDDNITFIHNDQSFHINTGAKKKRKRYEVIEEDNERLVLENKKLQKKIDSIRILYEKMKNISMSRI